MEKIPHGAARVDGEKKAPQRGKRPYDWGASDNPTTPEKGIGSRT
jgi:hypothetical protein